MRARRPMTRGQFDAHGGHVCPKPREAWRQACPRRPRAGRPAGARHRAWGSGHRWRCAGRPGRPPAPSRCSGSGSWSGGSRGLVRRDRPADGVPAALGRTWIGLMDGAGEGAAVGRDRPSRGRSAERRARGRRGRRASSALKRGMPRPVRRKTRPFCVSGGISQENLALERLDRHLRAEECLLEGDGQLSMQVVALAREDRVRPKADMEIDIAGIRSRPGLARESDLVAVRDAARDGHLEPLATDLDASRCAGIRLFQGDLHVRGGVLAGEPCGPRSRRLAPRRRLRQGPGRPGCPRSPCRPPWSCDDPHAWRSRRPWRRR